MAELEGQIRWQAATTSALASAAVAGLDLPARVRGDGGATLELCEELAIDDPAYRVVRGVLTLPGARTGVPVELDLNPYVRSRLELGLRPTPRRRLRQRGRGFAYATAAHEVLDRLAGELAAAAEATLPPIEQAA
ncbi:MAG: hypothetical protein M0004_13880 [Actinomycetota bacterium]|nr:hypothetical protein [Actinomycetota bacterium]